MKQEEKKPPVWEITDPKPPVVQSGKMENRKQNLWRCANFSLAFCWLLKYVAPPVRQRPQAAMASPGGEAVTKCNLLFVTDEECGRKSYGFLTISGFF